MSLHKKMITSSWLLDWYDVKYPENIHCINLFQNSICSIGEVIYRINSLNEISVLIHSQGALINLYSNSPEAIVVTTNSVVLFNENFQLIDSINIFEETLSPISISLFLDNQLLLQTANQFLSLDLTTLDIQKINNSAWPSDIETQSTLFQLADNSLKLSIGQAYRQKQISQLKFIQDLHSGQLFFRTGKFLTDLVAILTIFLVISSLLTWQRRKARTN